MERPPQQDVNLHVVGAGALMREVASLAMAGRGNVRIGEREGAMVSGDVKKQALQALQLRIDRRDLTSTEAVSAAVREELEKALDGTARRVADGNGQQVPLSPWRDDGEDRPKTHRSGMVGMEGLND